MDPSVQVMTVTGPRDASSLGHIQPHEHLIVHPTPASAKYPELSFCDESKSLTELRSYRSAGGNTLVDAQPVFAGRDAQALFRLSNESGIAIIAATGYHLNRFYLFPPPEQPDLYDLFCTELQIGMLTRDGTSTNIKAGIVKAAIDSSSSSGPSRKRLLQAARAARDCSVSLMLHTQADSNIQSALDLCYQEGLSPDQILVCHTDRDPDSLSLQKQLLEQGVWLECDTIGRFKYRSDASEAEMLLKLMDAGFSNRLLLSLDTTAHRLRAYGGSIGLDYLLCKFRQTLFSYGVTPAVWLSLTHTNPANALTSGRKE